MSDASAFSPDYIAARARFRSSALALGCRLQEHPIGQQGPEGEDLSIDVALLGDEAPGRAVVVSSGLHGVEGFLGSAVQAALLEDHLGGWSPPPGGALVLVHALNPYGFAWIRRVNEDNVDLNRNFLLAGQSYTGSPDGYAELDQLLNPRKPPGLVDPFLVRAVVHILRHGLPAMKSAVAGGQYEFPLGLFFGGDQASRTVEILADQLPRWVGGAAEVLHVDFHTGLGAKGSYKLLVDHGRGDERFQWLAERFGADVVEPWEPEAGVSYSIRGGLGTWCKERFPRASYDVLAAEFGTVHILKVVAALRAENQAHHWGDPESSSTQRAKKRVKQAFVPPDRAWRDGTVKDGLAIVQRALEVCLRA